MNGGMMARTAASARVAAALLAAALTAPTLVGCSSGNGPGPASADASGPLRVWARGANDSPKAYQAIFDAFTKKTGIKIEPFFTLTDFETKLTAAATAHKLPDVVVDDAAQLGNFKTQGIIQPVDKSKIASADQLTPASWDSAKDLKGDIYAVPFSAQANLLFIRSDWLAKLNLPAPKTWDDVATVAKAFTTGGPDAFATMDATAVKGKYTVVAPPAGPDNGKTLAEGTNIYLMSGGKSNAGKKLAEFMITPEAQKLGMTAVPSATIVRLPVNSTVDAATEHKNDARWTLAH